LPMPSYVRVTNLENGRAMVLRVNDRGPYAHGRIIDVSRRAAQLLGFERQGTAKVRVEIVDQGTKGFVAEKPVTTQEERDAVSAVPVAKVETATLAPPPGVAEAPAPVVEPPPPAQVAMVSVEPSDLYVQAGAFTRFDNANRLAARLFSFGETKIQSAIVGETEFFRVRIGPLASVEEADAVLANMIGSGFPEARIVVGPR
jgi:rare lipoprotein A